MRNYIKILRFVKPYKKLLVISFALSIIFSFLNAISVYLTIPLLRTLFQPGNPLEIIKSQYGSSQNIFDILRFKFESWIFLYGDKYYLLGKVSILIIVSFLLKNIIGYLQGITTAYAEKSLLIDIRRKLYEKYTTLSLKYFSLKRSGDIITRIISDVDKIQNGISVTFTNLIKDPLTIITFLTMSFVISWKLTLISLILFPIASILILFIGKKLKKYSIRVQEKLSDFTSNISETIYGIRVIKAFSMEKFELRKFNEQLKKFFRIIMKHAIYNDMVRPLSEVVSVLAVVSIIWIGGQDVLGGKSMSSEEFIGFLIIISQLMSPIKELGTINNRIQEASASADRIFEILDSKPYIIEKPSATEKLSFNDSIEFKNVSFFYEEEAMVLDNINLKINKNEIIAIVGASGVGKSTLVDLLPRFYDVTSGEILIDEINVKDFKIKSLRNLFSIVTQEIILFNDTIKNNIAYGLEDIPMDKIVEAAKNANAHDFIIETDKGYETIIGERGVKLSGGQKQRIAIARALLKNAPVLIFDEATSSLDTESELLIQEAINKLIKDKTSIVIAHRLSTIKHAHKIIVLNNGKIEDIGTHDDLLKDENSTYRKLYEISMS